MDGAGRRYAEHYLYSYDRLGEEPFFKAYGFVSSTYGSIVHHILRTTIFKVPQTPVLGIYQIPGIMGNYDRRNESK